MVLIMSFSTLLLYFRTCITIYYRIDAPFRRSMMVMMMMMKKYINRICALYININISLVPLSSLCKQKQNVKYK